VPVYEYVCRSCAHRVEMMQPMGAPPPTACPTCGGSLRRSWGGVAIRLSGWGFSRTDSLLPNNRRGRDFRTLKEKAEEITDADH
jgi:putative FmdB family regulatory protein